jgi:MFS family permease
LPRNAAIAAATVLQVLHVAAWTAYYTITRQVYRADESFVVMLASAETLPTIVGLIGGFIAERFGYRTVFAFGILEGFFLSATGLWLYSREALWLSALLASMMWSIAGPQVIGYVLTVSGLSGRMLGIVLAGGAIGWSLGGAVSPIAAVRFGPDRVLTAAGVTVSLVYIGFIMLPKAKPARESLELSGRLKLLLLVIIPSSLSLAGTEIIGSLYLAKLSREFPADMYALAIALSGAVSAAARPYMGSLVDRFGEHRLLPLSLILYAAYTPILMYTHGIAFFIAWLAPLYPLFDISLYRYTARLLGEALGSATVSASYSIAGTILLLLSKHTPSRTVYNAAAIASFLSAAILAPLVYSLAGHSSETDRLKGE